MLVLVSGLRWFSVLLALVIGWLSLAPLTALPAASGGDKLAHLIAYAALAFPMSLRETRQFMPFHGFIAYGGAIELVQPLVIRYGEWSDFAVNGLGCVLGLLAARLHGIYFAKLYLPEVVIIGTLRGRIMRSVRL